MNVTEAAERMLLSCNAVSELARRAQDAGLLRREQGADDARYVSLTVTPQGERLVREVIAASDRARADLAEALDVMSEVFEASHSPRPRA